MRLIALLLLGLCVGCSPAEDVEPGSPNILLFIGDDIGVEALASYGIGTSPAPTPHLDALANSGTQFANVWSQPTCSPTRATIITGRYGFRTSLGFPSGGQGSEGPLPDDPPKLDDAPAEYREDLAFARRMSPPWSMGPLRRAGNLPKDAMLRKGLPVSETGLPIVLKSLNPKYKTAAIGKWHLADNQNGWLEHPGTMGFDHYSVTLNNAVESFFAWIESVNGEPVERQGYTADAKLADALAWIESQGDDPWFLWYGFNLPHLPYFVPPASGVELDADLDATMASELSNSHDYFDLMVTDMDRIIGEMLTALPESTRANTIVIFVGDNGTAREGVDPPFEAEKSKFTLYQGGIHVPLIVSGPGVSEGANIEALVNTSDLFATILELAAGASVSDVPKDSVSLMPYFANPDQAPLRRFAYADKFLPNLGIENGDYTIRDHRYKYMGSLARHEFYDLQNDPYENNNLYGGDMDEDAQTALRELQSKVRSLHAEEEN